MGDNNILLGLLESVLGNSIQTARGNYAFKCPNGCKPSKNKLEINLNTKQYQCWICGGDKEGIRGKNLLSLFKKAKASTDQINELKSLTNVKEIFETKEQTIKIELPEDFKSLYKNPELKFIKYLKSRGLSKFDIIKYNIGYCDKGPYVNRVIIPSYDEKGDLNYFISRSVDDYTFPPYKNPEFSRDIIPFEFFINWNLPIIICEGPFDAIAIKRNVIPLLGKNIQPRLMKKLVESKIQKIYLALDRDAIKKSLSFCELLMNAGKEVYLVELEDKDPSKMGFRYFTNLIQQIEPLNFQSFLEKKLLYG